MLYVSLLKKDVDTTYYTIIHMLYYYFIENLLLIVGLLFYIIKYLCSTHKINCKKKYILNANRHILILNALFNRQELRINISFIYERSL